MPLVFVHGVNVRQDEIYRQEVLLRNRLLLNIFFPVAGLASCSENLFDAFWGDLAPEHSPGNLYLPPMIPLVQGLKRLTGIGKTQKANFTECADDVSLESEAAELDSTTASANSLLHLLKAEPLRDVLDCLIAVSHDEQSSEPSTDEQSAGLSSLAIEALALADRFETMEAQQIWLAGIKTDEDLLNCLSDEIDKSVENKERSPLNFKHSRQALRKSRQWFRQRLDSARAKLLAPAVQARQAAVTGVDTVRAKARETTTRIAARTLMHPARRFFHGRLCHFIGDSFYYFGMRGTKDSPGAVPQRVMDVLLQADKARTAEDQALIVVAHSMGGIVMADLVSQFQPSVKIECLVTVGSQFPLFADLKMFPGFDQSAFPLAKPAMVANWVNIFDPNDFLGFAAEQLFAGVVDVEYTSGKIGASTHADYFKLPSFYHCMATAVKPLVAGRK